MEERVMSLMGDLSRRFRRGSGTGVQFPPPFPQSYLDFIPVAAPVRAFELRDPTVGRPRRTRGSPGGRWQFQAELVLELASLGSVHMSLPYSRTDLSDAVQSACRSFQVRPDCHPHGDPQKGLFCSYVIDYTGDAAQLAELLKRYERRLSPENMGLRYFITPPDCQVAFDDIQTWDAPFDLSLAQAGGRDNYPIRIEVWSGVTTGLWGNEGRLARILSTVRAIVLPTYNDCGYDIAVLTLDPYWRAVASALYRHCRRWDLPCRDLAAECAPTEGCP
jgi:hypothetical protein